MSETIEKNPVSAPFPQTFPWSAGQLLFALLMLLCGLGAMWSAWADWYMISSEIEEHSHVFLVIPFIAAILYFNSSRLRKVKGGPSWVGPIIVAAGWALAWNGFNQAHQSFWHMGAVLIAFGAVITVLGHDVILKFWPAFIILGFMVPMPNTLRLKIAHPLQSEMARVVEWILSTFGEAVGRQGNSLTINGQQVLIVEACNGLRMVFTLILVSWLFAFVTPLKNWVRWLIILLSPLTALVCNVIRLIPTLLMYGHSSKEAADKFHDASGWAMVPVAFFMLMGVISLIQAFGFEVKNHEDDDDNDGKTSGGQSSSAQLLSSTPAVQP